MDDQARFYRRRLPRWRETAAIYFLTWRLAPNQEELSPEERELVAADLRHGRGRRYELHAYAP